MLLISGTACDGRPPTHDQAALKFIDGQQKTLQDYHGKLLLVNFWSVSCPPCFEEMPLLTQLRGEFTETQLAIIGIAMPYDRPDLVLETQQRKQLPYPIALDSLSHHSQAFAVAAVPTSLLLSQQGEILARYTGVFDYQQLHQQIRTHLSTH
ncbi:MAG: TlpA disulfide reductase family protein [Chromatiales bacterium]